MRGREAAMLGVAAAAFVLSGGAGLVYESAWTRYLGTFVGHAAYAQLLVLTIFLGGMAIGAGLAGARSRRIRRPLAAYVGIELVIAVAGYVFPDVFEAVTRAAYERWLPALGPGGLAFAVKWGIAAALILPQSVLLGATFPLMCSGLLRRRPASPGRVVSTLYGANSFGATVGVLAAGFVLLGAVGLSGSLRVAALANALAALLVWPWIRGRADAGGPVASSASATSSVSAASSTSSAISPNSATSASPTSRPVSEPPSIPSAGGVMDSGVTRLLFGVAFGTAVASFLYEIAWIRMLSLVLGSATHSFELMLSAFILGLALGAAFVRRRADAITTPLRALGAIQWAMGALALATIPVYLLGFEAIAAVLGAVSRTDGGYAVFGIFRYGLCLAVMLPSTFCAGMVLPLLVRVLIERGPGEGAVGRAYAVNTVGSIVGVVLGGAVLLPAIGVAGTVIVGACLDMALGVALLARSRRVEEREAPVAGAVGAALVLAASVLLFAPLDPRLLASGVYRSGRLPDFDAVTALAYRDGRTASVAALGWNDGRITLTTNGKPDASLDPVWRSRADGDRTLRPLKSDDATQVLTALVPLAHAPRARLAAIVGHGSGMTTHVLLGGPSLERVDTIEIEPAMIEASRVLLPANRRAFDDPRSRFVIDDARARLAMARDRYDIIVSEPSNPWVSGVSGLFTVEFYRQASRSLAEGGVLAQWLQAYELSDGLILTVLAALDRHFDDWSIHLLTSDDVMILATRAGEIPRLDASVCDFDGVREDLAPFLPLRGSLDALKIADRDSLGALTARVAPNTDGRPRLDLGAERARFLDASATGLRALAIDRLDLVAPFVPRPPLGEADRRVAIAGHPRLEARALALRLREAWARPLEEVAIAEEGVPDGAAGPGSAFVERWRARAHRQRSLRAWLAGGTEPADWRRFLTDVLIVEAGLHGGTHGRVFEPFYAAVGGFLDRHGAPEPARAALEFVFAFSRSDFESLAASTEPLLAEARAGRDWVPLDLLLDGAVLSRLVLRRHDDAREIEAELGPARRRPRGDLRRQLLDAWLRDPAAMPDPTRGIRSASPPGRR